MFIGYVSVSESDGDETLDFHINELLKSGVDRNNIFYDCVSGKDNEKQGLKSCTQSLSQWDTLIVWKLEFLGSDLGHLLQTIHDLLEQDVSLRIISGQGFSIDANTATGNVISGIFADLAGIDSNSGKGGSAIPPSVVSFTDRRKGPKFSLSEKQIRMIQSALTDSETNVSELCNDLGITRQTLYRYFAPNGTLRPHGKKVLSRLAGRLVG